MRPPRKQIFISAPSTVDIKVLRRTILDRGFEPFSLEDADSGTGSWAEIIGRLIDRADLVLVVAPSGGLRNPNVFVELGYALAKKKRILALVAPDDESPFGDIPYLRTNLDDKEAIGFGLDGVLSASRHGGKSKKDGIKKTKPIGTAADELLDEARGNISESKFIDIVRKAIEKSGVSTVVSEPHSDDRGVDLAVWSEDLEPLIRNPVVIDLKTHIRNTKHFDTSIAQLVKALDKTRTQMGLLIYAEKETTVDDNLFTDPRIVVFSLVDFLTLLKDNGFGDLLRRAKHMSVHVGN